MNVALAVSTRSLATTKRRCLLCLSQTATFSYSSQQQRPLVMRPPFSSSRVAAVACFLFHSVDAFVVAPTSSRNTSTMASASASALASAKATAADTGTSILDSITASLDNSWIAQLSPETESNLAKSRALEGLPDFDDNHTKRPVYNGHYVLVKPTPIKNPKLLLYSPDVAFHLLKLSQNQVESDDFTNFVSGNLILGETWATPYALSIVGTRYTHNCPYGTGVGYGDGRAISIGEFEGYELQLKGGGKTPFCRGADGRAVLRSSIREFLASESMHYLGIRTTRALSLVMSETDTVQRPWYSDSAKLQLPDMDDPRLADYSDEEKRQILQNLRNQKADPNIMIREPQAIACRVAPSFTRVGHFDLYARRVDKQAMEFNNGDYVTNTPEWKELEQLLWHACFREFKAEAYDPFIETKDIVGASETLLTLSAERLADMVAGWVRVGFAQGNFNADNCLVGGHTMDYGPFGFMEEYNPLFAKWTGSGPHFGFMNQPSAGFANYQILVESVAPLIAANSEQGKDDVVKQYMEEAQATFQRKVDETFNVKMGLRKENEAGDHLWETLQPLLRSSRVDWTLFWRQLTYVALEFEDLESTDYEKMFDTLNGGKDESNHSPFYEPLPADTKKEFVDWIEKWRTELKAQNVQNVGEQMRLVNPKYVLREWMLVDAYTAASEGDYGLLHDLFELIQHPYDEGTPQQQSRYYTRADATALTAGGTAFMS